MINLPLLPCVAVLLAILFASYIWIAQRKKSGKRFPPSASVLKLVVAMIIQGVDNLSDYFQKESFKLGPVFTVALGSRRIVILNTKDVIEAALLKQPSAYAGRERFYTEKHIFNKKGKGISMRQFDENYKRYHLIYMSILKEFGFGTRSMLESRIAIEVKVMLDSLKEKNSQTFTPNELTMRMVSNVVCSILFGRKCEINEDPVEAFCEGIFLSEIMDSALDVLPILRFLPRYGRIIQQLTKANYRMVASIKEEIEKSLKPDAPASFVSRVVDKEGPNYDHEQLEATIRELIIAGSDSTFATMLWSYVFLANNPSVQERMQREIDDVVPNGSLPSIDDQPRLSFVVATTLEIMRRATIFPLSVPRMTLRDTELCGYHIPTRTVVLSNLQAAHSDPSVWIDSEDFHPGRFLDADNNVIKGSIIPFSVGRRSCLGEELARDELFLFISGLVQHFTIKPPEGLEKIEVTKVGTIIVKPSKFQLRMIPRKSQSTVGV